MACIVSEEGALRLSKETEIGSDEANSDGAGIYPVAKTAIGSKSAKERSALPAQLGNSSFIDMQLRYLNK